MRTLWLASFPKSGSTWLRMLIANLLATDERPVDINELPPQGGIASGRELFDELTLIESGLLTLDEIDDLRPRVIEYMYAHPEEHIARAKAYGRHHGTAEAPPVRFIKVHDAYTVTRRGEPLLAGRRGADGAIVIVRDPRDVAASFANHNRTGIDQAIATMGNRNCAFCAQTNRQLGQLRQRMLSWSGHVASWLDQSDLPVLLLRYEELQADTAGALRRVLAFAHYDAELTLIEQAVRLADFSELRAQEAAKGFREAPRPSSDRAFFRRGLAGGWRDELTPAQVARLEADHGAMMQRLGYCLVSEAIAAHAES